MSTLPQLLAALVLVSSFVVLAAGEAVCAGSSCTAFSEDTGEVADEVPLLQTLYAAKTSNLSVQGETIAKTLHSFQQNPEPDTEIEDPTLSDLIESDAEKLQQQEAALKMEKLAMVEKREGNGDSAEESKLESELIEGNKTPKVVKEINDVLNAIHGPVDELVKLGVGMTDHELQQLSNSELGTHEQLEEQDEETENDAAQENGTTDHIPHSLLYTGQGAPCRDASCYQLWPKKDGVVHIRYCRGKKTTNSDVEASDEIMKTFKLASDELTEYCEALNFQEVNDDGSCEMRVYNGRTASVGYLGWKPNTVRCDERAGSKGLCMHEITHGLGRSHEQKRDDRDDYVTVHWDVVKDGRGNTNFGKNDRASIKSPYDIYSIMHYDCDRQIKEGSGVFDRSLRAHRRRHWFDGFFGWEDCNKMGQMLGYDQQDINILQEMYTCSERRRRAIPPPAERRRRWYS
eukprot:TRINITY_DN8244_c1_g1_i1.p1 TRINITY_DN8244_c1_g1~~TRINITY_DN8244_c1_g1_i1.p1  ORF type:complete len:459 (-),score=85.77 TRINITY_DN8244_c1_g1_i1:28-1404(-)